MPYFKILIILTPRADDINKLLYSITILAEIKHSDWLFQVPWLILTDHSALFQPSIVMPCYNLLMILTPGANVINKFESSVTMLCWNAEIKHSDWLFQVPWQLILTIHSASFQRLIAMTRYNLFMTLTPARSLHLSHFILRIRYDLSRFDHLAALEVSLSLTNWFQLQSKSLHNGIDNLIVILLGKRRRSSVANVVKQLGPTSKSLFSVPTLAPNKVC